jgi:glycosyltransferase involved in cell wall biosynthesis
MRSGNRRGVQQLKFVSKKEKLLLVAHFGEDYVAYRAKFLDFLVAQGWQVKALVPSDKHRQEAEKAGHVVSFYNYQRSFAALFYILPFYFRLKKILRQEKFTLLYTLKFFPNFLGVLAAQAVPGVRVAATIAGLGFLDGRDHKPLIAIIFRAYMRVLNKAHFVIIQNKDDLKTLQSYLPNPKLVLTYGSGVDGKRFENISLPTSFKNYLPTQKPYVVLCSRIVRQKGVKELVKGYLLAKRSKDLNFDLILAGWYDDKGLEQELQQLTKKEENIHLLGYQKDVRPLVSQAQAVVLPSYYPEGVPRSLTESLAMRKPIITTNHKGCRETCQDGENGFLVKPKSAESIAEALLKFNALSQAEINTMGENSYKLFLQKFEQGQVFSGIVEALEKDS